jgi:uncharacterized protein (DUF427 family)
MKAIIDGAVVADAPESDLISIEGNYYFPPSSIAAGTLSDSPTPYNCPWKGDAQYHDISANGASHHDAAWSYPDPYPASFDRVGKDYSGYIAFDKQQVTIANLRPVPPLSVGASPCWPRSAGRPGLVCIMCPAGRECAWYHRPGAG